jgi:PST family polysaccharide transporter
VIFAVTIIIAKDELIKLSIAEISYKNNYINQLLNFSIISLISAIAVPTTLLSIRYIIKLTEGVQFAGYWDAVNMISSNYFMFVSMTMSLFILPEFSKAKSKIEIKRIINSILKFIFPIFLVGIITMFIFRDLIISLLFTDEFIEVGKFFKIQFIGDSFKFVSWIFAFFLISKAKTKYFVIAEITSAITYITLSYILLNTFGSKGVYYAYTINYMLYLIIVFYLYNKSLKEIN